ncbi:radiation sensitive protein rad9 [Coniosporium tulheliwenetii]|uniref:Radiation sensitive protein rad9 n=1 Tax=Coniosporium tulheliwenetii TaxID=3383036 RepID=A0ACC2YY65_9PEZI|nr:radiation sensitive protein rad9 [Cladosporium sp. JES 115]
MPSVMVDEASSQLRLYRSFAGFDAGGDTQPMDSQIYKQYTSTRISRDEDDWEVSQPTGQDVTLHTGDAGYVNLVEEWEKNRAHEEVGESMSSDSIDELSPSTQDRVRSATSPKFRKPETPTRSSRKRNHHGEILSSVTRTPGSALTAFFGNANVNGAGAAAMSLSQAFNPTQAPSSPLPNAPTSDPVFQRPSPNFFAIARSSPSAVQSSPTKAMRSELSRSYTEPASMSSPMKQTRSDIPRFMTEPRGTYTTMKESQERREAQRRKEEEELLRLRSEEEDDDFGDEPTAAEQLVARQRAREALVAKTSVEFAKLSAPPRGKQDMRKKVLLSSGGAYVTPARSVRRRNEIIEISPDTPQEEGFSDGGSADELTTSPKTVGKAADVHNRDLQVPMTSSRQQRSLPDTQSPALRGSSEVRERLEEQDNHKSSPQHALVDGSPLEKEPQPDASGTAGTQTVAVADSQPEIIDAQDHGVLPPAVDSASTDANGRFLQSQLASLTDTARAEINAALLNAVDSSSLPRPPVSSDQLLRGAADERMPSSPPILPHIAEVEEDQDVEMSDDEVDLIGYQGKQEDKRPQKPTASARAAGEGSSGQTSASTATKLHVNDCSNSVAQTTIPETDPAEELDSPAPEASAHGSRTATATSSAAVGSEHILPHTLSTTGTTRFETARSHLIASPTKTHSTRASQSTPKPHGIRRFADIARDPTPEESMDVDLDINLITAEDKEFEAIMSGSSPVHHGRKRRKVYSARTLNQPTLARPVPPSEPPSSKPEAAPSPSETPQSPSNTQKREAQGAAAAVQARGAAILRTPAVPKPGRLSRPVRKTGNEQSPALKATAGAVARAKRVFGATTEIAETPQSKSSDASSAHTGLEAHLPRRIELPRLQTDTGVEHDTSQGRSNDAIVVPGSTGDVIVPNRVLALFKGGNMSFYPATCVGVSHANGLRFKVRFDDGTVVDLEPKGVRSLDLQIGDLVKVDLGKMRQKSYIIQGFRNRVTAPDSESFPLTDQHGHRTLLLAAKGRDSLANGNAPAADETVEQPPANPDHRALRPRHADFPLAPADNDNSQSANHSRRFRRFHQHSNNQRPLRRHGLCRLLHREGHDQERHHQARRPLPRDATIALITSHGGLLLEPGFDVLFEIDGAAPTPVKPRSPLKTPGTTTSLTTTTSATSATADADATDAFRLTPEAATLGFVALIADTHSRRAKYMQALALGLPCLHHRWLLDCVSTNSILPWAPYLLPAGSSNFLAGAVRSRVLAPYPAAEARFREVVARRERLLGGRNVVLVMGKGRQEERRRAYLFLTYALGGGEWDWVYVEGVEEARKVLGGGPGAAAVGGRKRKRKRGAEEAEMDGAKRKEVKIVGDEFVIQSLILGELSEE